MRKRLIELIRGARKTTKGANCDLEREGLFADYLLANGVIVPPCKVGDKLYRVVNVIIGNDFVAEGIAFEYAETFEEGLTKKRIYFWANGDEFARRNCSFWFEISEIGKTVFLTREEAEQALKGGGE